MKRKASIAALDDLYDSILKNHLLEGLTLNKNKEDKEEQDDSEGLEDLDLDDSSEEDDDEGEKAEPKRNPKIIEFSVTRLGKLPSTGSKKLPEIDQKGGVNGANSSKKKHKKRR